MLKVLNSNLNRKQKVSLPHHNNKTDLANDELYEEKIKKIWSKFDSTKQHSDDSAEINAGFRLSQF